MALRDTRFVKNQTQIFQGVKAWLEPERAQGDRALDYSGIAILAALAIVSMILIKALR